MQPNYNGELQPMGRSQPCTDAGNPALGNTDPIEPTRRH